MYLVFIYNTTRNKSAAVYQFINVDAGHSKHFPAWLPIS